MFRSLSVADVLFYLIVIAIVYMLVRPGSKAGSALKAVSEATIAVVGDTTGWTAPATPAASTGKSSGNG